MAFAESIENLVMFCVIAIMVFILAFAWITIKNDTNIESTLFSQTAAGTAAKTNMNTFVSKLDTTLLMGWFALHLGVIFLAFIFRSHPIFYILAIFIALILIWLAPFLSNLWETVVDQNGFEATKAEFPKVSLIMQRLPLLEVIWAFITSGVMFGLSRYEGLI